MVDRHTGSSFDASCQGEADAVAIKRVIAEIQSGLERQRGQLFQLWEACRNDAPRRAEHLLAARERLAEVGRFLDNARLADS